MDTNIPEWHPDAKSLLNRLTMIIGESGTGKSYLIKHLMSVLQPHIPQIVVFSPTNPQNHTYDNEGEVPEPFIHTRVNIQTLNDIWDRQEMMRGIYERANDINVLRQLFARVGDPDALAMEKKLKAKFEETKQNIASSFPGDAAQSKIKAQEDNVKSILSRLYKAVVAQYADKLKKMPDITPAELHAIKYRFFMPRLLIIFDDCTEQLKAGRNSEIMQRIFYKARHLFITTIMACHTDKTFDPELKKQVFVTIFTAPECFATYVDRASNGLDKPQRQHAHNVKSIVFTPVAPNQKLVWDRNKKQYYKYTASYARVRFCSEIIRTYAEKIKRRGDEDMRGNKYADRF